MKLIKEIFTDEEFNEIKSIKEKTGLTWREFIIFSAKMVKKAQEVEKHGNR